ncbi:SAICAR synthase-like protein [Myriangium duriaei CBS 260.36]|uniref:1-phosphatidylinositol-4-phosphate 5-kinase n=1 Tax=Myriangium duriaei CBS 260.36 TaxID=1168546 RepID=A0A9P4IWT6_9PEZI|nr:SAICAR synthase-like protein [Myriangium duriaei CBS 260.36]
MPPLDTVIPTATRKTSGIIINGHLPSNGNLAHHKDDIQIPRIAELPDGLPNGYGLHEKVSPPASAPPTSHPTKPLPLTPQPQQQQPLQLPKLDERPERSEKPDNSRDSLVVPKHRRSINLPHPPPQFAQDEDAARWAEKIKERRISSKLRRQEEIDDDRVLMGTKVAEGHENFETAYNMLTGIRFCVSRCNAKINRPLTTIDFRERRKTSFDVLGTELTPATKYDFKFKDYAPWVFRHLRDLFRVDQANYLKSLTEKYVLSELGSPGKSGSFFYFSRDYKYIIKTVHHHEAKFLRKILPEYYEHVKQNPDTLLSQFYGLHRVKTKQGKKFHFVIMNNLFPPHKDIHRTYDLKGSLVGREYDESRLAENPQATLKDINWQKRNMHLEFGPIKGDKLKSQMERDVHFLQKLKIMDYSLLVGIHDLRRGNTLNLRNKTLKVFQPGGERIMAHPANVNQLGSLNEAATTTSFENPVTTSQTMPNLLVRTPSKIENARKASQLRQLVKTERPVPMDQTFTKLPERQVDEESKKSMYFYADEGGLRATNEDDRPGQEIYYLGIIDCLTRYSFIKRAEHAIKSFSQPDAEISAVPPMRYGERFLNFMRNYIKPREQAGDYIL